MITNIIDLLRALDYVQGSQTLTAAEKAAVAKELKGSLPAKVLCHGAHETHDIAAAIFEKAASLPERTNGPSTGERPEETRSAPEARKEEHELTPRSKGSNVLPRENRKETGGSKGVARSQPR